MHEDAASEQTVVIPWETCEASPETVEFHYVTFIKRRDGVYLPQFGSPGSRAGSSTPERLVQSAEGICIAVYNAEY